MLTLRSKNIQDLLSYFFIQQDAKLYVNEMIRMLKADRRNFIRSLKSLEKEGILVSEFQGNQKYYFLNKKYPFLKEYKKIVLKTIGFEKLIREIITNTKGVKVAYIFGSYVKDKLSTSSDIDVLVVGDHSTIELQRKISNLQKRINREINVMNMGEAEFLKKKKGKDPFIRSILSKDTIKLL